MTYVHRGRKGESPNLIPRRRDRAFEINGRWYLTTRGGFYVGPYPTKTEADATAELLTKLLEGVDDPNAAAAIIREFSQRRAS